MHAKYVIKVCSPVCIGYWAWHEKSITNWWKEAKVYDDHCSAMKDMPKVKAMYSEKEVVIAYHPAYEAYKLSERFITT